MVTINLLCFDLLTLYLYVTHTTGMPQLKMVYFVSLNTSRSCTCF